jgi:hypothetical protein
VFYADGTPVPGGFVTSSTTAMTDSGLTPGEQYSYYVVASNGIGPSSPSNTASASAGL